MERERERERKCVKKREIDAESRKNGCVEGRKCGWVVIKRKGKMYTNFMRVYMESRKKERTDIGACEYGI